jgi:hypothetical protein
MNSTTDELRNRNLLTLAGLAALFMLPLLGSLWLYYGTGWRPAGHVNHGELITPPRRLTDVTLPPVRLAGMADPEAARSPAGIDRGPAQFPGGRYGLFHGTWTLAYIGDGACDAACRRTLYVMRQTRRALGMDTPRVTRVFLVTGHCCAAGFLATKHPGLLLLDASGPTGRKFLEQFPRQDRPHSLFIVDPLGNLMMRYDVRRDPRGLLIDLRRLLALSDIG